MKGYAGFIVTASLLLPAIAHADTLACTLENEVALRASVARSVSGLKIAQYRADAALLETSAGELEAMLGDDGTCPAELKVRLCDADCYYQRGSAYLFRATGVPLLSSKSTGSPSDGVLDQQALLEQSRLGLLLVDEALARLPRQQVAGGGDTQKANAFNGYLKSLALLNGLKAKLLVAAGDTWYRAASVSQINRLNYAVDDALGNGSPTTGDNGDEYSKAMVYYDEAFWLTMEAQATLPVSDLFTAELSSLASIDKDVESRLDSVRKGYLFIGIDPEDFTFHSIEDLGRQLWKQRGELDNQEKTIAGLLQTWKDRYKELADQNFDLANLANARAIDNEVYKISQVQDEAGLVQGKIQTQLDKVNGAINKFDRQRQINVLQADLKKETMDLRNQLTTIQGQKEQDLLTLHKEDVRDQLDDYRFNIDMTLAEYNFQMQIDSLDVQLKELQSRVDADNNDLLIAQNRQQQIDASVSLERRRIDATGILVSKYRTAQGTVFASEQEAIGQQIASVDAELGYYGGNAQALSNQICAERAKLVNMSKADLDHLKTCIDAGCGGPGLKEAVNQAFTQNQAMANAQRATIQKTKDLLTARVSDLQASFNTWMVTKALEAVALVAQEAASAAALVPEVTVGLIGVFPVELVSVTHGVESAAKDLADAAVAAANWAKGNVEFDVQVHQEMTNLKTQLADLDGRLKELDVQKMIDTWAKNKALAEINVQLAGIDKDTHEATNQLAVQKVECSQQQADLDATRGKLKADRASLVAELAAKTQSSSLLNFDIEEQNSLRAQSEAAIQRLSLERRELDLEIRKINQDKTNLASMESAVSNQMTRVGGFKSKVKSLEQAYDAKLAVLNDVKQKIKAKTISLSDAQAKYVTDVIDNENNATFAQITDIQAQIQRMGDAQGLQQDILDIDLGMRGAVLEDRKRILDLATRAPQSNANAIFWDFEKLSAELTHGASEILEEKRALLQNINFTYNLYRNRYNMLTDFTTDIAPIHGDVTFVRTASDVTRVMGMCGALGGVGTAEICNPDSLVWSKSTVTGLNAEFTVEKNTGLLTQLRQDGRVRFEISPFGSSQSNSKLLGDFTLWDNQTMNDSQPMLLVHAMVGLQSGRCGSQQVTLRHLGSGVQFEHLSEDSSDIIPTLVGKRPVTATLPVYADTDTTMTSEYDKFHQASYTAEGLERKLHDGTSVYPFVGYPVIGTYELIADDNLLTCLGNDATGLKLGFIFVRKGSVPSH